MDGQRHERCPLTHRRDEYADLYACPDISERYMGRCFHCDRSVADHDQAVCDWIPVPDRGQWQLPREAGSGLEAAMVHVAHLDTPGAATSSRILWEQECPAGCSLLMQTSIDFERTWQEATRGDPVTGFADMDQPAEIRARVILRGSGTSIRDVAVSVTYGEVTADA
jgi:hypothetical protein